MPKRWVQEGSETSFAASLVSEESRLFQGSLFYLCEAMAPEEEDFRRRGDKRQDTSFKASSEAHSIDPGGSDRCDKRRDGQGCEV